MEKSAYQESLLFLAESQNIIFPVKEYVNDESLHSTHLGEDKIPYNLKLLTFLEILKVFGLVLGFLFRLNAKC